MPTDYQIRLHQEQEICRLVDALRPKGVKIAARLLGNMEDVEEAVQDALIRLLRSLGDFREEASLSTMFYKIVQNECLRRIKRRRPRGESLESAVEMEVENEEGDPARAVEKEETREILHVFITRLPKVQREAVIYHYIEELPFEEIGRRLGIAENVASVYVSRARVTMREMTRKGELVR